MPVEVLIPLAIFIVLLVLFGVVLRRVWQLLVESRDLGAFRRTVRDLAGRVDETLDGAIVSVDRLRRHQVDVASITSGLDRAIEGLLDLGAEARRLAGPPITAVARSAFVAEIERAERALQMVEHGCAILGAHGAAHRQVEAETAIKRGFLNLVHARAAIARHAADIEAVRPQEQLRWLTGRRSSGQAD